MHYSAIELRGIESHLLPTTRKYRIKYHYIVPATTGYSCRFKEVGCKKCCISLVLTPFCFVIKVKVDDEQLNLVDSKYAQTSGNDVMETCDLGFRVRDPVQG